MCDKIITTKAPQAISAVTRLLRHSCLKQLQDSLLISVQVNIRSAHFLPKLAYYCYYYYRCAVAPPASSAAVSCAAPFVPAKGYIPELPKLCSPRWAGSHCLPELEKPREFWPYGLIIQPFSYHFAAYQRTACTSQHGCFTYEFGLNLPVPLTVSCRLIENCLQ